MMTKMKYVCLVCEHAESIETNKESYQEVRVCPKCKGALVDVWKIGKYVQKEEETQETNINLLIPLGIVTINEVRVKYGLKPIPSGNVLYVKP